MAKRVKILVVQNGALIGDKKANFARVNELLEGHESYNPDLIVFTEVWNVGWCCEAFFDAAESGNDSDTILFLKNIAQRFNSNVLGGSYIRKIENGELRNTCPVFDRKGNLVCMYDKMHLYSHCGAGEGRYVSKGNSLVMANLDIGKIGLTICYDLRFPEIFRKYTYAGADLLVNMGAWAYSKKPQWTAMQRVRAIENQSFMIGTSQTGVLKNGEQNLGNSMVVNPMGEIVAALDEQEGVLKCEIDLDEMIKLRENIPTLKDTCEEYNFSEDK